MTLKLASLRRMSIRSTLTEIRSAAFLALILTSCLGLEAADEPEAPLFRFGAVADCQYCDVEGGQRRYRLSKQKLSECVEHLNTRRLAFVVHLGDFIDRDFESFDVVDPIYKRIKTKRYHVLGNHDFSVADELKASVPKRLEMSRRYYDFSVENWRFVVLDGNDISFHAYPEGSDEHRKAQTYYRSLNTKSPDWNGALGLTQLTWLDQILSQADIHNQQVVLFCHFPIYPPNVHNLWNSESLLNIIDGRPSMVAYINGHNHAGHYGERKGKHFLTLHGMVDTETTAYSIIEVYRQRLEVIGVGRQPSLSLKLLAKPDPAD